MTEGTMEGAEGRLPSLKRGGTDEAQLAKAA